MISKRRKKKFRLILFVSVLVLFSTLTIIFLVKGFPVSFYLSAGKQWFVEHFVNTKKSFQNANIKIERNYIGIDISKYQGLIDWEEVSADEFKGRKIEFCFVKATEGVKMQDKYFKYNWQKMDKLNIYKGAYHFFYPQLNIKEQFNNFTSAVELSSGDLPPVVDIEVSGDLNEDEIRLNTKKFLDLLESHYNVKPIIYCSLDYYKRIFSVTDFKDYPFWIAYYSNKELPIDENSWLFWQKSDKGLINGINHYVDINVSSVRLEYFDKILIK